MEQETKIKQESEGNNKKQKSDKQETFLFFTSF